MSASSFRCDRRPGSATMQNPPDGNQTPSLLDSTGHSRPQLSTAPTTRLQATLRGAMIPRPHRDSCTHNQHTQQATADVSAFAQRCREMDAT